MRKSFSRHASVSTTRSPDDVTAPSGPKKWLSWIVPVSSGWKPEPSDWRRMPTASISSMNTMHWPPHLLAIFLALRARKRTITASMPMNVWAKPGAGDGHERAVERRGDGLREHRLAGARSAEEEHAA